MRLHAFCSVAALLSASTVLADTLATSTPSLVLDSSPATSIDDYYGQTTPFPELVEDDSHLEIRQNLAVNPNAEQASGQVPPVTAYSIATQMGQTGQITMVTYTQKFSNVPDQWPSPKPGTIGMGTHQKRGDEAANTGIAGEEKYLDVLQPIGVVREVVVVTVFLRRVTEVLVVETVVVSMPWVPGNGTATVQGGNGSFTAAGSIGYRPWNTASRGVLATATRL